MIMDAGYGGNAFVSGSLTPMDNDNAELLPAAALMLAVLWARAMNNDATLQEIIGRPGRVCRRRDRQIRGRECGAVSWLADRVNKTLVFCTSYSETPLLWTMRYRVWLNAIRGGDIEHDHVLLVDDASPVLPEWRDTHVTSCLHDVLVPGGVTVYRYDRRLGRQGRNIYPGWYRSFCFAARFAELHKFEKVVHIESDGFIITSRMQQYINAVKDEWVAPAIQSHAMPESAIQIIAGSGLESWFKFARIPYSNIVGTAAENILPFTLVEGGFIGSRYGETLHHVPREADFVTQTNPSMRGQRAYYWWIRPDLLPFE